MTMFDDRTVFDKLRRRPFPDYYDTMYLDGYKPWEIIESAHRTMIKEYNRRKEEHNADSQAQIPMNVKFDVEVKKK